MKQLLTITILALLIGCESSSINSTNNDVKCYNGEVVTINGEFIDHTGKYYIFLTESNNYNLYLDSSIKAKIAFGMTMSVDIVCRNNNWHLTNF